VTRVVLLIATGAAAVVLCAGCQGMSGSTAVPPAAPATAPAASGSADQLGSQLDQMQSTLDSVQAQVDADSNP
jgi:hypothetical protein